MLNAFCITKLFQKKAFNYRDKLQVLELQHKAEVQVYKGEHSHPRLIYLISQLLFSRLLSNLLMLQEINPRRKKIMLLGVVSFSDSNKTLLQGGRVFGGPLKDGRKPFNPKEPKDFCFDYRP